MFDKLRLKLERRLAKLVSSTPVAISRPHMDSGSIEALRLKGNSHLLEGDLVQAEACFRLALNMAPDNTHLFICLGFALKEQDRLAEARIMLRKAVGSTAPEVFEAYYLLGQISELQQDWEDAFRQFSFSLDRKPDFVQACEDGIRMLVLSDRREDMLGFLGSRVEQCPEVMDYRVLLGCAHFARLEYAQAVQHLQKAVQLGAHSFDVNLALGQSLARLNREEEARPFLEMVLRENPSYSPHVNFILGICKLQLGDEEAAINLLESAIQGHHDYVDAHTSLLMLLSYSGLDSERTAYIAAARRFADILESSHPQSSPLHEIQPPSRTLPLRVGFVAGEFRIHPLLHFLVGILMQVDPQRIHTIAFSNNNRNDYGTELFKSAFDQWFDIRDLNTTAATELIRGQRVDVLIDLCGLSGDGRLPVFAKRAAPVQVSWLGYWATTGLSSMDYILADHFSVPENSTEWFSEKVYRMPNTRLCMTAPRAAFPLPVTPPPCLSNQYVTFGSFQRIAKLNTEVLNVWARILRMVPNARLRIQTDAYHGDRALKLLDEKMTSQGIDTARVDFYPLSNMDQYLLAHKDVDLILDTFPFPGGTTTAQALWMGVPTVTLVGNTMLSRQGASILSCVGLTDWIAKDESDYLRIACQFAQTPRHLAELRSSLRDRVLQSPLFDVKRFADDLADALWSMADEKRSSIHASSEANNRSLTNS